MKILPNKTLNTAIILLLSISESVLAGSPPPPGIKPPPKLPINENLVILITIALLFGLHTIYKHKLNKKTPI
jgi:hypothetical protein